MSDWTTKRHVVAEGDLPEDCQKVLASTHTDNCYILWWEFVAIDRFWYGETSETYRWPIDQVKYWWALPEIGE